jgi:hypothetical protein
VKRLVVTFCAIYCATVALAAATMGHALVEPVPGYRLSVFWMAPETLDARVNALLAAGRSFEAMVYAGAHTASCGVLGALALIGLIRPFLGPSRPVANWRATTVILGGFAGLAILSYATRPLLDLAGQIPSAMPGFAAMPAYWLFGMVLSVAVTGGHLSLAVHDLVLWLAARWRRPVAAAA